MRIIAGEFRSRQLLAPRTDATRPITDRVKQSLFDILAPEIPDSHVYDCFAGTGSMGLECLSRGAAHATFFESDRSAATLLRKNIAALGVQNRSTVIDHDLFKWFEQKLPGEPTARAALIFVDPPYRMVREQPDQLRTLVTSMLTHHLTESGQIIFRHDANDTLTFEDAQAIDSRTYGNMSIEVLRRR
jgi:16S rRNA (guanine(966)-N(2))-methyltransferase RsmD